MNPDTNDRPQDDNGMRDDQAAPIQVPTAQPQTSKAPESPISPEMPPTVPTGTTPDMPALGNQPKKKAAKGIIATIIIIIVLIAAGIAAYYLVHKKNDRSSTNQAAQSSTQNAASTAIELARLNKLTFQAPGSMNGFAPNDLGIATVKDYLTANQTCELQFGTLGADKLPGTDLGDIVAKQLATYRSNGATVTGPTSGAALILKDATDSNKSYSLPTLVFEFTEGSKHLKSYYSAAVLKSGDRAFVGRVCQSGNGAVNDAMLAPINAKAAEIKVAAQ